MTTEFFFSSTCYGESERGNNIEVFHDVSIQITENEHNVRLLL